MPVMAQGGSVAYCTQANIQHAAGGSNELIELTDRERTGRLDTVVLADAQAAAESWIDSYVQRRFQTTLATPPACIITMAADETIYVLRCWRGMASEDDRARHENREQWLRSLVKGEVSPGTDPPPAASSSVCAEAFERSDDEDICHESLKGFW
jgi:phage gp36-like protein